LFFATAGRNYPIPGDQSQRLQPRVPCRGRLICGVLDEPAPRRCQGTASSIMSVTMVALVAALGAKQAVIVGHDWGAPVAWHAAMFRPDFSRPLRVERSPAVPWRGGRSTPCATTGSPISIAIFQNPGVAEGEFERDVALTMRTLLGRDFPIGGVAVRRRGKGFLGDARSTGRCRIGSVTPILPISRGLPKSPASAAGSTGTATSTATGTDRALARRANPSAIPVHCRIERFRHYRLDRRQTRR